MALSEFRVVQEQEDSDFVLIHSYDGRQLVLNYIRRTTTLMDKFELRDLSKRDADALVMSNLGAFSEVIQAKYGRDDYRQYSPGGGMTFPRVDVTYDDIKHVPMSAAVLKTRFGLADAAGRF